MRRPDWLLVVVLVVLSLLGCGKSSADAGRDGGDGDGARDAVSERGGDGKVMAPVGCNGRCAGNCVGVCTGICSQRMDDGTCSGRCEEICVGMCEGTCTKVARPDAASGDARGAAAGQKRPDGGGDGGMDPPADASVGSDPAAGIWSNRANTSTLSWPPAGHAGAMAFDSARNRVVMFGGATSPNNTTWEWDGALGAWELRQQMAGARPSRRYGHAMAFDVGRGKVVLYGGIDESGGSNGETWEWDGASQTWTMKNPGPAPSRWGHAMAYDKGTGHIVMFGGSYRHPTLGDGDLFDIWEYEGANDTWTNKTYPLPPAWPRARRGHAMAYDAARSVTVMFGGEVLSVGGATADLWEWDSSTNQWTDRTLPILPPDWPGPRAWHGLVDSGDGVLLFGGSLPSLWQWDGATGTWRALTPGSGAPWPAPRTRTPLAWDETRRVLVLSGGVMTVGSNSLADLWEWSRP